MSWRTTRVTVTLRDVSRCLGLNRLLSPFLSEPGYEMAFQTAVLSEVREADCVWDVGANIGVYTMKFATKVGAKGKVYAFEPSPTNRVRLETVVEGMKNITVVPFALGARDTVMKIVQGADAVGATSHLEAKTSGITNGIDVTVAAGKTLVAKGEVSAPNAVKIDTEGCELDVVEGLGDLLTCSALRAVFIEVHFALLKERGMGTGPRRIEQILCQCGFHCRWADASHIVAVRTTS